MRALYLFWLTLCLILLAGTAFAEEKIQSFDVVVNVDRSGDFTITETIRVNVEGKEIRRGIFRDIPRFLEYKGRKLPQKIEVLSVSRNGQSESFKTSFEGNVKRIRIGQPSVMLPHQLHAYEITYKMDNQIRRFSDADEIYWNVTGSYWNFPIESASAKFIMPEGAKLTERNVATGRYGSRETNAIFGQAGEITTVQTVKPLGVREGMTVSLRYAKGVIAPQTNLQMINHWWLLNGASFILAFSFLAVLGYYLRSWFKVGKDPVKDPVFPRYHPPENYSPAAVAHIHRKGMGGTTALMAALISLGVKKRLHIDAGKKITTLVRQDNLRGHENPMARDEAVLMDKLFGSYKSDTLTLRRKYNATFTRAMTKHGKHLSREFGAKYYRYNGLYIAAGIILSAISIFLAFSQLTGTAPQSFVLMLAALAVLNIFFIFLMPAPTIRGQKVMSEIEGLKLFIKTAEKPKLDAVDIHGNQPPPMSVDRYEELLPYAVALGVEKPWSKHFENTLPVEAENYDPTWSAGNYQDFGSMSKMTSNMMSNLTSSAQHAQPQSSSSSGGGGGGFSGGGGGGGGGGGW